MIPPALLLAGALAIIGWSFVRSGGVAGRVAALLRGTSRPRMILGWAAGTAVSFLVPTLVALLALGRVDAIGDMPLELRIAAWRLGLPAGGDAATLGRVAASAGLGVGAGFLLLLVRRRRGRGPIGLRYRSPAAAREQREWPAAAALALSAGVSEELFFRLLLPLLIALVSGSAPFGFAAALVAFTALHRHQGRVGLAAVFLVGAALTYLYLLTGRLWVAIVAHVLIDLNALVLRPWLTGPVSS